MNKFKHFALFAALLIGVLPLKGMDKTSRKLCDLQKIEAMMFPTGLIEIQKSAYTDDKRNSVTLSNIIALGISNLFSEVICDCFHLSWIDNDSKKIISQRLGEQIDKSPKPRNTDFLKIKPERTRIVNFKTVLYELMRDINIKIAAKSENSMTSWNVMALARVIFYSGASAFSALEDLEDNEKNNMIEGLSNMSLRALNAYYRNKDKGKLIFVNHFTVEAGDDQVIIAVAVRIILDFLFKMHTKCFPISDEQSNSLITKYKAKDFESNVSQFLYNHMLERLHLWKIDVRLNDADNQLSYFTYVRTIRTLIGLASKQSCFIISETDQTFSSYYSKLLITIFKTAEQISITIDENTDRCRIAISLKDSTLLSWVINSLQIDFEYDQSKYPINKQFGNNGNLFFCASNYLFNSFDTPNIQTGYAKKIEIAIDCRGVTMYVTDLSL